MKGITPFPTWLPQEKYEALSLGERALLHARSEYEHFRNVPTMETLGTNRGERIDQYAREVGVPVGQPWCATFVTRNLLAAGWRKPTWFTNPASSCNWLVHAVAGGAIASVLKVPKRGCIGGWCRALGGGPWQGHLFHVAEVISIGGKPIYVRTIEGNSNEDGSREGNRIVERRRLVTPKLRFIEVYE